MGQKLREGRTFFLFTKVNDFWKETGVYITVLLTEKVKASHKKSMAAN